MADNRFKLIYDRKREALRVVEETISSRRSDMLHEVKGKIDLFLDACHGAALREARDEYRKATKEFWADRVARSKAGEGAIFTIGALVRKAKYDRYSSRTVVGFEYAVYEVYEPGAPLPDNMASYSRPDPGDFIVRYCKQDGTPALRIEKLHSAGVWVEVPENENPWRGK